MEFRTQPDGLWFTLGLLRGDEHAKAEFGDCVAIESCGNVQNLHDKRARYAARTTSLLLVVQQGWLDREVVLRGRGGTRRPRREILGGQLPSSGDVLLPVRHLRLLYALPDGGEG